MQSEAAAVQAAAEELVGLTDVHGLPVPRGWGLSYLGWALVQSGETAEGIARLDLGLGVLSSVGAQIHATLVMALRAECLMVAGRYDDALAQAEAALDAVRSRGELTYLSRLHSTLAAALRHIRGGSDPVVSTALEESLAVARRQKAKGWELFAATNLARYWAEQGRPDEARELLEPVYGAFTEGLDAQPLRQAKALLDGLA